MHLRQLANLKPAASKIDLSGTAALSNHVGYLRASNAQALSDPNPPASSHNRTGGWDLGQNTALGNIRTVEPALDIDA